MQVARVSDSHDDIARKVLSDRMKSLTFEQIVSVMVSLLKRETALSQEVTELNKKLSCQKR